MNWSERKKASDGGWEVKPFPSLGGGTREVFEYHTEDQEATHRADQGSVPISASQCLPWSLRTPSHSAQ